MKRMSSVESFTGTVKHNHKFNKEIARIRNSAPEDRESIADRAHRQINKSSNGKSSGLTLLQRQGDYLSEAMFRSQLRNYEEH